MADTNKDTIYIDIDDEITTIIDKVSASSGKVVALVLPKRATTLQSMVNMKLLKRSADQANKNLVLVTTETGLMPLAGAAGLHVAKTPNSRPEIPSSADSPDALSDEEAIDLMEDESEPEPATADNAGDKSVGALAVAAGATMPLPNKPDNSIETVELDNEDAKPVAAAAAGAAAAKAAKSKKNKKLQVPDFDRFRMLLIFGGLALILLIVGAYFAFAVLPKATIAIKTNASNVNTNVDMALSTTATTLSATSNTIPAKQVSTQKTLTGTAPATGQKNNGEKATGSVTLSSSCSNGNQIIPAGTGVSSSSGKTYITQKTVTLTGSPGFCNGSKQYNATVTISSQAPGTSYNTSAGTSFKLSKSNDGSYDSSTISGSGSTSGGTDDIQTVVAQADIDAAKAKLTNDSTSTLQEELSEQLKSQGQYPIVATYVASTPAVTNSANVGDPASAVTVTGTITYTMLGAKETDINTLIDNDIKNQIDTEKQDILTRGLSQSAFKLKTSSDGGAAVNVQTVAEVGPSLDTAQIAKDATGKKSNEIKSQIESNPDVTEVTVTLSPFWVTKAPKNVDKITVTIAKPTTTANAN
jgi:hypothetical protein